MGVTKGQQIVKLNLSLHFHSQGGKEVLGEFIYFASGGRKNLTSLDPQELHTFIWWPFKLCGGDDDDDYCSVCYYVTNIYVFIL